MVDALALLVLDGCRYFLVGSGWSLLFLGVLWIVVISWWALDGA